MSFFGITFLDDIDLPEFPFPDLGLPEDGDDALVAAAAPADGRGERD
jgi:hypothetical protein